MSKRRISRADARCERLLRIGDQKYQWEVLKALVRRGCKQQVHPRPSTAQFSYLGIRSCAESRVVSRAAQLSQGLCYVNYFCSPLLQLRSGNCPAICVLQSHLQ
jgi:hypothetical protein